MPCTARVEKAHHPPGAARSFPMLLTALLGLLLLLAPAGLLAQTTLQGEPRDRPNGTQPAEAPPAIAYEADLAGPLPQDLLEYLRSASDLVSRRGSPPASLYLLERRIESDQETLRAALRSRGFYDARIAVEVAREAEPVRVVFNIEPGPVYRLGSVDIEITDATVRERIGLPSPQDLGLTLGQPALAEDIADVDRELLGWFRSRGHPFPSFVSHKIIVDHATQAMAVRITIAPGPPARFGEVNFVGLETVDRDFLEDRIPWAAGEPYDGRLVDRLQNNLIRTGLFSLVQVTSAETVMEDGTLPITVQVTEALHRTVRTGLYWRSDEGFGARASWEHRNLLGGGENLELSARVASLIQAAEARFRKPDFLSEKQILSSALRVSNEDTDAYLSRGVFGSTLVSRAVTERLTLGAGIGYDLAKVTPRSDVTSEDQQDYFLLSLPLRADWLNKNDLLNPTSGQVLGLQVAPFYDVRESEFAFYKGIITGAYYQTLMSDPQIVFALRSSAGSIVGSSRSDVPADKRFYAGGGGSVRGYAYQTAGPLDQDDNPKGGRSLFEASGELRFKVTEDWGFVLFLDGGNVYDKEYPEVGDRIFLGTGAGIRYFTPVGPVRFDVGVPLDRRAGVDDPFQVYISIGQAF